MIVVILAFLIVLVWDVLCFFNNVASHCWFWHLPCLWFIYKKRCRCRRRRLSSGARRTVKGFCRVSGTTKTRNRKTKRTTVVVASRGQRRPESRARSGGAAGRRRARCGRDAGARSSVIFIAAGVWTFQCTIVKRVGERMAYSMFLLFI